MPLIRLVEVQFDTLVTFLAIVPHWHGRIKIMVEAWFVLPQSHLGQSIRRWHANCARVLRYFTLKIRDGVLGKVAMSHQRVEIASYETVDNARYQVFIR